MKQAPVQLFVPPEWPGKEWSKNLNSNGITWHISAYNVEDAIKNSYSEAFFREMAAKGNHASCMLVLAKFQENTAFDTAVLRGWLNPEITGCSLIVSAPENIRKKLPQGEQIIPITKDISLHDLGIVVRNLAMISMNTHDAEKSKVTEIEWLARIEQIFKLTNSEIRNAEASAYAFQQLVEYEQHLLSEQKRVTAALVNLQEYRDKVKGDWIQERTARENIEGFMRSEMKSMSEVMKAQEQLLKYAEEEKKMFRTLMAEFNKNGSLSKDDLRRLLTGHEMLLKELDRLQNK